MNKMNWVRIALTTSLVMITASFSAQAATLRAFVSSTGNDANAATNCAQTAPCRTFAGAFPTVTAGGELIALDTAGYGPLTINKAITIAAVPGATAFVVAATGTAGFTVSAGAGDLVVLRNINFNGSNAANTTGINHTAGKLDVYDCKFSQLTTGIIMVNTKARLLDCIVTGNTTGASVTGAGTNTSAPATALLTITRGSFTFNGTALSTTNPGTNPLFNIFVLGPSNSSWYTDFSHNTVFLAGTGTGCPCTSVGTYSGFPGNPN